MIELGLKSDPNYTMSARWSQHLMTLLEVPMRTGEGTIVLDVPLVCQLAKYLEEDGTGPSKADLVKYAKELSDRLDSQASEIYRLNKTIKRLRRKPPQPKRTPDILPTYML